MFVRKVTSMQHILNSRTEKAIRNELQQTGRRIAAICEEIDSLRADCYLYRHKGDVCNLVETDDKIQWKIGKLMKAINRRNKLGSELSKYIKEG